MATSDYIKALFRAFTKKDESAFLRTAKELIAEEHQKGHKLLAQDLSRIINNGSSIPSIVGTYRET